MGNKMQGNKVRHEHKLPEISTEEKELIDQMHRYQNITMSETHKKMFVDLEKGGNYNYQFMKHRINNLVNQIKSYLQMKKRNDEQISGKVEIWKTIEDFPGQAVTKEDLVIENERIDLMIWATVNNKDGIKDMLLQMSHYVGQLRIDKQKIDTWEGYDMYIQQVNNRVKDLVGYGVV